MHSRLYFTCLLYGDNLHIKSSYLDLMEDLYVRMELSNTIFFLNRGKKEVFPL